MKMVTRLFATACLAMRLATGNMSVPVPRADGAVTITEEPADFNVTALESHGIRVDEIPALGGMEPCPAAVSRRMLATW